MPKRTSATTEPPLKRELLEATRQIFVESGIEAISMRKVAAAVGCTATAIYLYFKDKESLLDELVGEDFLEIAHALETLRGEPDPVLRMRGFAMALFRYGQHHPHHYRFLFMTPRPALRLETALQRNRPEENAYLMAKEAAQQAIDAGRIHGRFKSADALVQVLLSSIHGVISLHLSNFTDPWIPWIPLEQRATLTLDTLFAGITTA